jgi:hypothetical protein
MRADVSSGSATVRIDGIRRGGVDETAAPFSAARFFFTEPSISRDIGTVERNFEEPIEFGELTDIWFKGTPSTGTPIVTVAFTMLFEKL